MNNATFFKDEDSLINAWNKWVRIKGYDLASLNRFKSMADFSTLLASTALRYDIGQVVMDPVSKIYGVITGYCRTFVNNYAFNRIVVRCADGKYDWEVPSDNPDKFNAKIPKELLELAKSQLQENCPLKEATCH